MSGQELANTEESIIGDFKSYDVPKTIIGSIVGFFVWKFLSDKYPPKEPTATIMREVTITPTPVYDMQINDAARKSNIIIGW